MQGTVLTEYQKKYLEFNKSMNRLIVDQMREKVEKISNLSREDQTNTAFQVRFDNTTKTSKDQANINIAVDSAQFVNNTRNVSLVVKDGTLKMASTPINPVLGCK